MGRRQNEAVMILLEEEKDGKILPKSFTLTQIQLLCILTPPDPPTHEFVVFKTLLRPKNPYCFLKGVPRLSPARELIS